MSGSETSQFPISLPSNGVSHDAPDCTFVKAPEVQGSKVFASSSGSASFGQVNKIRFC